MPMLSIIIPTYNSAASLAGCLDSIAAQTYTDYEVIIIDSASTDKTPEIAKNYSRIVSQWISEKDNGVYDAFNKGISHAQGRWLYFLGSDDILFRKDTLREIFDDTRNLDADVCYGSVIFKNSGMRWHGKFSLLKLHEINICHQAIFFKKNVFQTLGFYDLRYRIVADWEFNLRWFSDRRIKKRYINKVIAVFNEKGLSGNQGDAQFSKDFPRLIEESLRHAGVCEKIIYALTLAIRRRSKNFPFTLVIPFLQKIKRMVIMRQ